MDQAKGGSPHFLSLRGIRKSFGAVSALEDVQLDVNRGEVMALLGDNGAGKSTLIKIISGVIAPDAGQILIDGESVVFSGPDEVKRRGIETVYQDLALISTFNSIENIYLGRELTLLRGLILDHRRMVKEAKRHLADLAINVPSLGEKVRYLSGGQRQAVAIGRATGWGAKLIIMDEPTAALGVKESRQVVKLIGNLKASNVSVVVISHNIEQVFQVSDRMTVLRHGRVAASLKTKESNPEEVVRFITGAQGVS
jgi:ABC-type sugar transport system ATPase subunit